jgi:hypothetical protein
VAAAEAAAAAADGVNEADERMAEKKKRAKKESGKQSWSGWTEQAFSIINCVFPCHGCKKKAQ